MLCQELPLRMSTHALRLVQNRRANGCLAELFVSLAYASSFVQVLSIGETVEEVNDSGFEGKVPTIRCQLMADDSMLQVRIC